MTRFNIHQWGILCIILSILIFTPYAVYSMRIGVIGSGNFGSAVARNVARNLQQVDQPCVKEVKMWVYDEQINGRSIVEIINTDHENVKYLPGISLPKTVVAVLNIVDVCSDADVLFFVLPHEFLGGVLSKMKGHTKPTAVGVSMIKSMEFDQNGPKRLSSIIQRELGLRQMAVVMGANIAHDVAVDSFVEATVASTDAETAERVRRILESRTFRTDTTSDVSSVEYCGALKNLVAVGAGICDGIGASESSKAALMRQGLREMERFCEEFDQTGKFQKETMLLSCGVADLIATCHSGRNSRCGAAFARALLSFHGPDKGWHSSGGSGGGAVGDVSLGSKGNGDVTEQTQVDKLWAQVFHEVCDGQHPPGIATAAEVVQCLLQRYQGDRNRLFARYPLFTRIHEVAILGQQPGRLFDWVQAA